MSGKSGRAADRIGWADRLIRELTGELGVTAIVVSHDLPSIARELPADGQRDQVRVERLPHGGKGAGWRSDGEPLVFDVPA